MDSQLTIAFDKAEGKSFSGELLIKYEKEPPQADPPPWDKDKEEAKRLLYLAYLDDLARVGGRHETVRAFYLTLLTAVWAFLALAGDGGIFVAVKGLVLVLVGAVGLVICAAWFRQMRSFHVLFKAKKAALCDLEVGLVLKPFSIEATKIDAAGVVKYISGTQIDAWVAGGFSLLFVGVLIIRFLEAWAARGS